MSKITISEAVQQYIAERTDVAGGYYEYIGVISQKHALEAAEMVKQETKENTGENRQKFIKFEKENNYVKFLLRTDEWPEIRQFRSAV